jgi:hypothetical protein
MAPKRDNINATMRELFRDFAGRLPEGVAGARTYTPAPGDRFADRRLRVPDGTYRVTGSDWLIVIKGETFLGAELATRENDWGGADVVQVPSEDPPAAGDDHGKEKIPAA